MTKAGGKWRSGVVGTMRWLRGMAVASFYSLVFLVSPIYNLSVVVTILANPWNQYVQLYSIPFFVSLLLPPIHATWLGPTVIKWMLDYFDYDEIFEVSTEELRASIRNENKRFIVGLHPHGIISFVSFCVWANADEETRSIKSAAASVIRWIPILKHAVGIFGLVDASSTPLRRHLQQPGSAGCVVLYVGGIAELFLSSPVEERLYLRNRKGFIKIALRERGVDVIPGYLFGNTGVLSQLTTGPLAALSRKLQVSITYFWGKYNLPIPRDEQMLYVRGKPLGLPYIPEPTAEDVDKWHAKYCQEVTRIFDSYKEKLPNYKHKTLHID